MFINVLPFFLTRSRNVRFLTVEAMPSRSKTQLINGLKLVNSLYRTNGFLITICSTKGKLACLRHKVPVITLDTSAKNDHVCNAVRTVLTAKDCICTIHSGLPFRILPTRMIIRIVVFAVMWHNAFPTADGVPDTYSSWNIIAANQLDYTKH